MSSIVVQPKRGASGRWLRLMDLYADNYWRLTRVFGPDRLTPGAYRSRVDGDLPIELVLERRSPYTLDLSMSYRFAADSGGASDPAAHIRLYRDARLAEVLACHGAKRIEDAIGRDAEPDTIVHHRLRMNAFLNKWLDYLAERGHSRFSLAPDAETG